MHSCMALGSVNSLNILPDSCVMAKSTLELSRLSALKEPKNTLTEETQF